MKELRRELGLKEVGITIEIIDYYLLDKNLNRILISKKGVD
jgi:hypothetical protein